MKRKTKKVLFIMVHEAPFIAAISIMVLTAALYCVIAWSLILMTKIVGTLIVGFKLELPSADEVWRNGMQPAGSHPIGWINRYVTWFEDKMTELSGLGPTPAPEPEPEDQLRGHIPTVLDTNYIELVRMRIPTELDGAAQMMRWYGEPVHHESIHINTGTFRGRRVKVLRRNPLQEFVNDD